MKYFIPVIILLLVPIAHTLAQTGLITGTVKNEHGEPLSDVNIFIQQINRGASTDGLGRFRIQNVPTGICNLTITAIGYEAQNQTVEVNTGTPVVLTITLHTGDLVLSDVVVTGHLEREINTISQLDIKLRPVNTSQDILRMVPGLFIAQHAGGGKAEQIFLRGFDIDHGTDINLEVDGLPVNMVSHAHGQGYSDLHFLIPELVSVVDFNKGPYDAAKGNFTTAGYAAFHTRNVIDQNTVKIEGGRYGTLRNVNIINLINRENGPRRDNAYIASEFFRTDGYFESKQYFNRFNIMGKYNSYLSDTEVLTIGLSTFTSSWDASGQIPERAVESGAITRFGAIDDTEGGETSRTNVYVKYSNALPGGSLFQNQLYYTRYDFNLVSNFTFFLNDPVNGDQITQSESRNIYGYRGSFLHEYTVGNMKLQSEMGAGFRYDNVNDIRLSHTKSRKEILEDKARGDVEETNLYAFISETLAATPRLSINAAVRFDHFTFNYTDALIATYDKQSISKAMVSPKLNVSYAVGKNVNLFVKTGIGFHANDTRVVVAQNGKDILPRAYGMDVGGTFKIGRNLFFSPAVWILDLDQEFVYVGDEGIVEPGGKTRRKGVDLSLRYQINNWLYLDGDVNVTTPEAKGLPENENYIPLAPDFTSVGGLSFKLANGINGSLRYRYLDDRPANEDNSVVADGYFLADAVLKYTRPAFELSFSAENIFNTEWKEAQFDTESRLQHEADAVSEIHFTPGTPFFFKAGVSIFF